MMFVHLTANQQKNFDKNVGGKIVQMSIKYSSNELKKEKLTMTTTTRNKATMMMII